jgi:hypothetical protein
MADGPPASRTYHDQRERREKGVLWRLEQWREAGGRLYERRATGNEPPVVRVASAGRGLELRGEIVRPLRPAELAGWEREVRMVPSNFLAHAAEMNVVTTQAGGLDRLEAPAERLVLERESGTGHARRVSDLRAKTSIEFDQPKDAQGRAVPRQETKFLLDREVWRDRITMVEFDVPVPVDVRRLWEGLERGGR